MVEATLSDELTSLLWYEINYGFKIFYDTLAFNQCYDKTFFPSLMLRIELSLASLLSLVQHLRGHSSLTRKNSLLRTLVNYVHK